MRFASTPRLKYLGTNVTPALHVLRATLFIQTFSVRRPRACAELSATSDLKGCPRHRRGLRKLEYRGYDSAGIAVVTKTASSRFAARRASSAISKRSCRSRPSRALRHRPHALGDPWPPDRRKRPSASRLLRRNRRRAQRHHRKLSRTEAQAQAEGHKFVTETDTEIIAHLVEKIFQRRQHCSKKPCAKPSKQLRGVYRARAFSRPRTATKSSPPASARRRHRPRRRRIFRRQRYSRACWTTRARFSSCAMATSPCSPRKASKSRISTASRVERPPQHVAWDPIMAEKGGYKHFMQKEIFEQPRAVRDTTARPHLAGHRQSLPRRNGYHAESEFREFPARQASSPAAPAGTRGSPGNS